LPEALRSCASELPPSYLALVEAGLKTNRLSDSLVAAARLSRTLAEMQQYLRTAMVYPLFVVAVAYAFFLLLVYDLFPRMARMFADSLPSSNALVATVDGIA